MSREKVIKELEFFNKNRICLPHLIPWDEITDAIAMLKKQEEQIRQLTEELEELRKKRNEVYYSGYDGSFIL